MEIVWLFKYIKQMNGCNENVNFHRNRSFIWHTWMIKQSPIWLNFCIDDFYKKFKRWMVKLWKYEAEYRQKYIVWIDSSKIIWMRVFSIKISQTWGAFILVTYWMVWLPFIMAVLIYIYSQMLEEFQIIRLMDFQEIT